MFGAIRRYIRRGNGKVNSGSNFDTDYPSTTLRNVVVGMNNGVQVMDVEDFARKEKGDTSMRVLVESITKVNTEVIPELLDTR